MTITKDNPNWGKTFVDKEGKTHTWVPKYGKYLDDLNEDEWNEMANATCGTNCDAPD